MINTVYNLSVSKKLLLFALVPTVTILIFAFDNISSKNKLLNRNEITHDFVLTSMVLTNVVTELQKERGLDAARSQSKLISHSEVSLTNQQRKTDEAFTHYLDFVQTIKSTPQDWQRENKFKHFETKLDTLLDIRLREYGNDGFDLYSELIDSIISVIQSLQTQANVASLASQVSVYSSFLTLQELIAQERALMNGIFTQGRINGFQSHELESIFEKQNHVWQYLISITPKPLSKQLLQQHTSVLGQQIIAFKQTVKNRSERSDLLNKLQTFFGYGGLIHNFKNYLLRSDPADLSAFHYASKEVQKVIYEMRQLNGISITELNYLDDIEDMVFKYKDQMSLMQVLIKEGLGIKQIDAQVKTNDFLALNALSGLLIGEVKANADIWWEKTEQQLSIFDAINEGLKEDIIMLSQQSVDRASQQLIKNIVLTLFALFIIILLAVIILKRLLFEVSAISNSMKNMVSTGHYDDVLEVMGTDEIAMMATSFNALLSKINTSQKQLISQKSAMDEHSIVATTDLKGAITYVNQKFCDISGYSKEELIGTNHRILNSKNQPKDYWRNMFLTVSKGNVWHDEVMNVAKNGQFYWVDTTIVPITWDAEDGSSNRGYIAIRTDITKRKQQEKVLLDAKIAAEAATIAKTQFLATMSHEIRTPMNGVIGMAQLLEDTPLNEEQKEYLDTITRSGTSLLTIINDILDFSKLDADMVEMENIPFDLERVCHESLLLVSGNAGDKAIEFVFDYAPDCPRHFVGDPSRMRQVLLNFLGNSVKFTKTGFIRLGIACVKTHEKSVLLKIDVQDTGIGLKPEAIKTLFDEFTQADTTTTREYGGTGLGLAITKKIIHLMNGSIEVESVFGEGSTFSLKNTLSMAPTPVSSDEKSLRGVRVLFVDDLPENRRVFKHILNYMGAKITLVTDPLDTEAIALLAVKEGNPYQIIMLDHNMQHINGLELGAQIRKNPHLNDVKLLMFSSIGQKGDAAIITKIGFDAYLNKLSRYETLQAVLSALLSKKTGQPLITQYSIMDSSESDINKSTLFKAKILLVEDLLPNQIVAQKLLTKMGVEVDVANNGAEAVEAVKQKNFDLVFMDCRMPILDGYEATRLIREYETDTAKSTRLPIVALTANASKEDQIFCTKAGMDDMVTKPFKRADLTDCLHKWLKASGESEKTDEDKPVIKRDESMIIDMAIYRQLQNDMDEDFEEVKIAIIDSIQSNITLLEACDEKTPMKDVIRYAHSLKSPAANLGLMQLAQLATTLEKSLQMEDLTGMKQSIIEINSSFFAAKRALPTTD